MVRGFLGRVEAKRRRQAIAEQDNQIKQFCENVSAWNKTVVNMEYALNSQDEAIYKGIRYGSYLNEAIYKSIKYDS